MVSLLCVWCLKNCTPRSQRFFIYGFF
jgi:hypothetical protein